MARETTYTTPYPNLDAWTITLESKVSSMLLDYFTTNYDQSTVFTGKIISFLYTVSEYNHNPVGCADAVRADLATLCGRYFQDSEVMVDYIDDPSGNGKYDLDIRIEVKDKDSGRANFNRIIKIEGTRLARMLKYNNEGVLVDEWKSIA